MRPRRSPRRAPHGHLHDTASSSSPFARTVHPSGRSRLPRRCLAVCQQPRKHRRLHDAASAVVLAVCPRRAPEPSSSAAAPQPRRHLSHAPKPVLHRSPSMLKIDATTNVAPPSLAWYVLQSIAVELLCRLPVRSPLHNLLHGVVPAAAAARFGLPAAVHDPACAGSTVHGPPVQASSPSLSISTRELSFLPLGEV